MNHSKTVKCSRGEVSAVQCSAVSEWSRTIHRSVSNARATTAISAKPQPGHVRHGWMDAPRFNGGQR